MTNLDSGDGGDVNLWGIVPNPDGSNLPPIVFRKVDPKKTSMGSPMRYFAVGFDARADKIQQAVNKAGKPPTLSAAAIDEIMKPLNALHGLESLKAVMRQMIENLQVQKMRAFANKKPRTVSAHMVFCGQPGTGKTMAARIVANILHKCGQTENDTFIAVGRSDLTGEYIGESEQKTRKVLQRAKGGVLFIDEAYSLNKSSDWDYGHDVINVLVTEMDKPDFRTVVICAGYEGEMKSFLASNPGLKSRFGHVITFNPPTLCALMHILDGMVRDAEYQMTSAARIKFENTLKERLRGGLMAEGNVRTLRQLLDEAISRQASRLVATKHPRLRDLSTIIPADIPGDAADFAAETAGNSGNIVPFRR